MSGKKGNSLFMYIVSLLLAAGLILTGCASGNGSTTEIKTTNTDKQSGKQKENVVKIGYQKNGPLVILKGLGTLEKRLEPEGYKVEWKEFTSGPALMEALNGGSINFGRTGDSPPIFAQAANTPFVYVAAGKSKFKGSGILVHKDSRIKSLADLKGKKIGFAKGSSAHYLLVKGLEKAGISYGDIQPSFLQPGDARVAFEQGNIDAWAIWDPFTADTEIHSNARLLKDGEGLTTDRDFFLANTEFEKNNSELIDIMIDEIQKSAEWANSHHDELVAMLSPLLKIDEKSLLKSAQRRDYGLDQLTKQIISEQQEIADTYVELGIIPKKINVMDVVDQERMAKE
ncbi:sulfonate ABC transporter substrate-binding protein [Peribacillus saganii]|uniref:Putative aliphatic sulfonates-binding protein n=1 Tax=Peribacillus saganii TaxID=2303992 RepID=A0A372LSM2_9BACI|nr:sulfonate ABC transporter substrate-binding protein [Peribacillus saganii]RFU71215.1 sulfonate ABC transporter substrate-binding protein [Peribacillus saganii]